MVEKFKKILAQMKQDNKKVSLLAVLKMDEVSDRWSIVFSGPGLEDESLRQDMFKYLIDLLSKNLTEEETQTIARVGVLTIDKHLVQDLLKFKPGHEFSEAARVNGNIVYEGFIVESKNFEVGS